MRRNGEVIHERIQDEAIVEGNTAEFLLADILEYADTVDIEAVSKVLEQQIEYNGAICAEGLKNDWGVTTGKTLMDESASMRENIIAFAAAGSDARMNGCAMPVVINSGSGNQGITVSIPVVAYAKEIGTNHEKLIRALVVANLVSLYQKKFIGRLSAFCGATSAAAGAIAGIAYLDGADESCISAAITNTIATVGGMVCDGAKSSCAMKIYTALSCAFMGYDLAKKGVAYCAGDGVVKDSIDATIHTVGRMAKQGMKETDKEVLHIMLNQ